MQSEYFFDEKLFNGNILTCRERVGKLKQFALGYKRLGLSSGSPISSESFERRWFSISQIRR